ncbi:hypothetical protein AAJ76_6500012660 [Vairimorpha ceranae]|uniref:18S rRNA aminocarboxypropyltransferase n=1 Tax=Vairimorpha ceranae TaxID=40302 RepID=A0A0F9WA71_9MICR|nr:hypothetical protein AAJ76_6500012660 [Vairimorpha ceranae]KAF5141789.1 hypothetical protein G9O61_00g000720 [Vairimorpha ceranae]KKO74501.1 hypothetical protein AAJ76_6500012660 [Vairimorpha ceranae]
MVINKIIYEFDQCDPKRCSGRKLVKTGKIVSYPIKRYFNGIILSPNAVSVISPNDRFIIEKYGLGLIDCSWNQLEKVDFCRLPKRYNRLLPFVVASNPVNYGKAYKLNCVEALSCALYICGFKEEAYEIIKDFNYGDEFYKLNGELLERYSKCNSSDEVLEVSKQWIDENTRMKE